MASVRQALPYKTFMDSQSPLYSETEFRLVDLYRNSPLDALRRLTELWESQKDFVREEDDELSTMLYVLSMFFKVYAEVAMEGKPTNLALALEDNLWSACVETKLPLLSLHMVQHTRFYKQPFRWMHSVLVISGAIPHVWYARAHSQAVNREHLLTTQIPQSLAERWFEELPAVCDALWKQRDTLLSDVYTSQPSWITTIVSFLQNVVRLLTSCYPEHRGDVMKFPSLLGLVLAVATYVAASPQIDAHRCFEQYSRCIQLVTFFREYYVYLRKSGVSRGEAVSRWRSTIEPMVEEIGALQLMRGFSTALSWPFMTGVNLLFVLNGLQSLIIWDAGSDKQFLSDVEVEFPSRRAYWEISIPLAIAQALKRELKNSADPLGSFEGSKFRATICMLSCRLLRFTHAGFINRPEHPPVVDGGSVYRILTRCAILLSSLLEVNDEDSLSHLNAAVSQFSPSTRDWALLYNGSSSLTPIQAIALRRVRRGMMDAAGETWDTDARLMYSLSAKFDKNAHYRKIMGSWGELIMKLDIKPIVEAKRRETGQGPRCSWTGCAFYDKPPPTKLSVCAGCGEQRYCSRTCQKTDWKHGGHREKCRRLNVPK